MTDDSPAEHTLPHHLEHLAMTADDIVALVTRAHQEGEIHPEVLAKSEKLAVGLREVVNELVHRDESGLAAQPSDVWKMLTAKHRGSEDGTIT